MRIAIVSDCYLPRLGGIEVQTSELAARLVAAGHAVEVFTLTPADGFDDSRLPHPLRRMPSPVPLPNGMLVNPLAAPHLRARLRDGQFDVVHAPVGVLSPFAFDGVRIALALGIPVAVTWHSMVARFGLAWSATGLLDAWAARGVVLSAVSQVAADAVSQASRRGVEVAVLPNGIDLPTWWQTRLPADPAATDDVRVESDAGVESAGGVRVVSAMRLAPRKRPLHLLDIMRRARELAPNAGITLELVGEGELRGRIERAVRAHGDEAWVSLPGRLSRDELRARYRAADLYVSPVKLEAFGIAALEARCCGLPVVGYSGSGVTEFVQHGLNGLLVGSDDEAARALARLASDTPEREAMRLHNLTVRPERFDWPQVVEATLAEYARAGAG